MLSFFINAYVSIGMLNRKDFYLTGDLAYMVFQLNFGAILLILLISMSYILHRGFGALSRLEQILDEIIKGKHSLRIKLRKGDVLIPLADKINKIIDLLEKKGK
jgi:hypothetical protein